MVEADLLTGELRGRTPDVRIPESLAPTAMKRVAHHADVRLLLHDHRIRHVRFLALRLQEDAHEPEGGVDLVLQARETDAFLGGDRDKLPGRKFRLQLLHVIGGDEVDLVHDDECPEEHAVPREDVDELVFRDVVPHDDRAVQVAPLPADVGDHFGVQRREVVRGDLARRIRDLIQERGLANAREADEPDRRVPALLDRVTRTAAAPLEAPRLLLVLEARELRLQPPDVVLGRLVVRRLLDLVLNRLDLFLDRHLDTGPIRMSAKRFLPESGYQTVRMPSGSRPLTAYRTMRRERAVYGDRSRPPRTRWTKRPSASSFSLSSASVYARTDAMNSRVPFRSMITWRVSNRPRSRSNDASSRTTVPSSRACQVCDGNPATRLSRLNSSIRNFPRGRSARAIPRSTSRSSSGRSKYPNDVNIEIAASNALR